MSNKPSAQGTFAKTPFAHLLLYTLGKRLNGTLAIWPDSSGEKRGRGQDRVLFEEGSIVAMRPIETADSIYVGLLRLFRRHDASYGFYENQNLLGVGEGLLEDRVDLYTLLARGLRDHAREDVMESVLAKVAGRPLRIRKGVPLDRLELTTKELGFIETLRAAPATPEELIAGADLPSRDARRLLYLLTLIRGVEAVEGNASLGATMITMSSLKPAVSAPPRHSMPSITGSIAAAPLAQVSRPQV